MLMLVYGLSVFFVRGLAVSAHKLRAGHDSWGSVLVLPCGDAEPDRKC